MHAYMYIHTSRYMVYTHIYIYSLPHAHMLIQMYVYIYTCIVCAHPHIYHTVHRWVIGRQI